MTIQHDEFDQRLADTENLDALDDAVIEHAAECGRCRTRLELARRIRTTAATLVEQSDDVDNITDAVLSRTHGTRSHLPRLLAAAAALVVVTGAASFVLRSPNNEPDVLADVADEYADSTGIRFVYATEASVDLSVEFDDELTITGEATALSAQLPTCADTTATDSDIEEADGLDLGPIAEAIAVGDPCLALELIGESARPATEAFDSLARTIEQREAGIDRLLTDENQDPLVAASANAFIEDQREQIEAAQRALTDLDQSFTALAQSVEPIASDEPGAFVASSVETDLIALQADTTAAEEAVDAVDPLVEWTQIATGTWTPDSIEIEGVTERGDTVGPYNAVTDDPLGLASAVLATPEVLLDLLRSAPASTDDMILWDVPADVLPDDTDWAATARLSDGQLIDIQLRSTRSTITLTPER